MSPTMSPITDADNWIVVLTRNNLDLTLQACQSFALQDIGGVRILVVNNGSTDGTAAWVTHVRGVDDVIHIYPQKGVANGWNRALRYLFGRLGVSQVLVCNNDVILRPDTYRLLDRENTDFVTAVGHDEPNALRGPAPALGEGRRPHPDFSCFLISQRCWDLVGPFDEGFKGAYAEDSSYHCQMHQAGIIAYSIALPFVHVGGGAQTIKRATDEEAQRISEQADRNRAYFKEKWGFEVGSEAYYDFFKGVAAKAAAGDPEC